MFIAAEWDTMWTKSMLLRREVRPGIGGRPGMGMQMWTGVVMRSGHPLNLQRTVMHRGQSVDGRGFSVSWAR